MRRILANALNLLARWLGSRAMPPGLARGPGRGPVYLDSYRKHREPTALELLGELKNTAWTCATINASVCACFPPRLYVSTAPGQAQPKCLTRALPPRIEAQLRAAPQLAVRLQGTETIAEVIDHPLLTLFRQVNPVHNSFDLWEISQLYLEIHGCAYWY